jgi:cytochrome c oxidase assembly protein subunit 15
MTPPLATRRTAGHQPSLARFAAVGGAWVFALVLLGAFTTSINAGMIFLDWPLSNGSLNPAGWLSDLAKFAEHSHRLSAGLMSMITIALAVWVWLTEARGWVRKLAIFAVVLVFTQALVGGLRVLLEKHQVEMINTSVGRLFAMLHACLAQIYVCTLLALVLSLSRGWIAGAGRPVGAGVRRLGVACCALLLVQLAVAAVMRHSFAGWAITTFPMSTPDGALLPAAWNFKVGIHFTHRVLAALLSVALPSFAAVIWRDGVASAGMRSAAAALVALLVTQITLGAEIIWTARNPYWTTAHVLVGALTLATTFGLTWWAHRPAAEKVPAPARDQLVEKVTVHA